MSLSTDERDLLTLVARAGEPVEMTGFFKDLNPPSPGLDENHPDHPAWTERQIALYGVVLSLHEKKLVHIVAPANGDRPDLVEPTPAGHASLAAEEGRPA